MNKLFVGSVKTGILKNLPADFLFIDDGALISEIPHHLLPPAFDVEHHHLNPLKDMSYRRACDLLAVLDAVFPEGANTLTRRYSNFILLDALLSNAASHKPKPLERLLSDSRDPYIKDAYQRVMRLFLSPVLKRVFDPTAPSFPLQGRVVARINRAELGNFDAFVLGNLLAASYPGTVIIPDFGFYACALHRDLIRQDRLVAGVNFLDEAPEFRNDLLLIPEKTGTRCIPEDAATLASFEGLVPDPTRDDSEYNRFIRARIA